MEPDDRPSLACPKCRRVTHNENDIKHKFCPVCGFYDDPSIPVTSRVLSGRTLLTALVGRRWVAWFRDTDVRAQGKIEEQAIARLLILHGRRGVLWEEV